MQLATGEVPILRSKIPADDRGVDQTVALMVRMARGIYGGKSPRIRALAINIINQAGVRDKDYYGMAEAIHNWVRDEIRYIRDPIGQETLSYPEETAFNTKAGDCDDKTILEMALLASLGIHSYPVVISTHPSGTFSHVYLHVIIPDGAHPRAGEIVPADPIMRQWPFGREADDQRVTRKKLYRHLIKEGTVMRVHTNAPNEINGLGAYATSAAYLDEENSVDVPRALRSPTTFSAPDPGNTTIRRDAGELVDDIFKPMEANRILARGPMTNAGIAAKTQPLETKHKSFIAPDRLNFRPSITLLTPADLRLDIQADTVLSIAKALEQKNKNDPSLRSVQLQPIALRLARKRAYQTQRRAAITQRPQDIELAKKFATAYHIARQGMHEALQSPLAHEAVRIDQTLQHLGDDTIEFVSGLGDLGRAGWHIARQKASRQVNEQLYRLLIAIETLFKEGATQEDINRIIENLQITVAPKYIAIKKLPNDEYIAFGVNNPPIRHDQVLTYQQLTRYAGASDRNLTAPTIPITSILYKDTLFIPLINAPTLKVVFDALSNKRKPFLFTARLEKPKPVNKPRSLSPRTP